MVLTPRLGASPQAAGLDAGVWSRISGAPGFGEAPTSRPSKERLGHGSMVVTQKSRHKSEGDVAGVDAFNEARQRSGEIKPRPLAGSEGLSTSIG